jgi:hypothetical protein
VVFAGTLLVNTGLVGLAGPAFAIVSIKVMLFPAVTGFGDAELPSLRSNWPAVATVTIAVELLLPGFESVVVDVVLAVFEIFVPDVTPAPTVTVSVNVVVAPEGRGFMLHVTVGVVDGHAHAVPVCVRVRNVVLAGIGSLSATFAAAAGPLFVTTIE